MGVGIGISMDTNIYLQGLRGHFLVMGGYDKLAFDDVQHAANASLLHAMLLSLIPSTHHG